LSDNSLIAVLRYYGVSPWEIEVVYGLLNSKFQVNQEEINEPDPNFVSVLTISIPVQFSEEFFKWFEFRAWEKTKAILKEMKRRRGRGKAIKIEILFQGEPNVRFVVDQNESYLFNSAIEKIDFVVELFQYHIGEKNISGNMIEVVYKFDPSKSRWGLI
jgi:hypothetical protein